MVASTRRRHPRGGRATASTGLLFPVGDVAAMARRRDRAAHRPGAPRALRGARRASGAVERFAAGQGRRRSTARSTSGCSRAGRPRGACRAGVAALTEGYRVPTGARRGASSASWARASSPISRRRRRSRRRRQFLGELAQALPRRHPPLLRLARSAGRPSERAADAGEPAGTAGHADPARARRRRAHRRRGGGGALVRRHQARQGRPRARLRRRRARGARRARDPASGCSGSRGRRSSCRTSELGAVQRLLRPPRSSCSRSGSASACRSTSRAPTSGSTRSASCAPRWDSSCGASEPRRGVRGALAWRPSGRRVHSIGVLTNSIARPRGLERSALDERAPFPPSAPPPPPPQYQAPCPAARAEPRR